MLKISRRSLLEKRFDVTEEEIRAKFKGAELASALELLPTPEEKEWMKVFTHNAPEREREKRKMSVCLDMEVSELEDDRVSGTYSGLKITITAPKNPFKICRELEKSKYDAFSELCKQHCVEIDDKPLIPEKTTYGVDVLSLCMQVADRFFFQTYIT